MGNYDEDDRQKSDDDVKPCYRDYDEDDSQQGDDDDEPFDVGNSTMFNSGLFH